MDNISPIRSKKQDVTPSGRREASVGVHEIPANRGKMETEIHEITENISALSLKNSIVNGDMCPALLPRGPDKGRPSHFKQPVKHVVSPVSLNTAKCPLPGKRASENDNIPDFKFFRYCVAEYPSKATPVVRKEKRLAQEPIQPCTLMDVYRQPLIPYCHSNQPPATASFLLQNWPPDHLPTQHFPIRPTAEGDVSKQLCINNHPSHQPVTPGHLPQLQSSRDNLAERFCTQQPLTEYKSEQPGTQCRLREQLCAKIKGQGQSVTNCTPPEMYLEQFRNQVEPEHLCNPHLLPEQLCTPGHLPEQPFTPLDLSGQSSIPPDYPNRPYTHDLSETGAMPGQSCKQTYFITNPHGEQSMLQQEKIVFSNHAPINAPNSIQSSMMNPDKYFRNAFSTEELDKILSPLWSDDFGRNHANFTFSSQSCQVQGDNNLQNCLPTSDLLNLEATENLGDSISDIFMCRRTRSLDYLPYNESSCTMNGGYKEPLSINGEVKMQMWMQSNNGICTPQKSENISQLSPEPKTRVLSQDRLNCVHPLIDSNEDQFTEALKFIAREIKCDKGNRTEKQKTGAVKSFASNRVDKFTPDASAKQKVTIPDKLKQDKISNCISGKNTIDDNPARKSLESTALPINLPRNDPTYSKNLQMVQSIRQTQNSLGRSVRKPVYVKPPKNVPQAIKPLRKLLPKMSPCVDVKDSAGKSKVSSVVYPRSNNVPHVVTTMSQVTVSGGVTQTCSSSSKSSASLSGKHNREHGPLLPLSSVVPTGSNRDLPCVLSVPGKNNKEVPRAFQYPLGESNEAHQQPCQPSKPRGKAQSNAGSKARKSEQLQKTSVQSQATMTQPDLCVANNTGQMQPQLLIKARRFVAELKQHDLRFQDQAGDTYLHMAICRTDCYMVKALLERMSREGFCAEMINKRNQLRQTPLYVAVADSQPLMVRELIQCGADPNCLALLKCQRGNGMRKEEEAAIHCAAQRGHLFTSTLAELLKAKGIALNLANSGGLTALHCAIQEHGKVRGGQVVDSIPIVEMLLQARADPNVQDRKSGKTSLMYAIETKDYNLVRSMVNLIDKDKLRSMLKTQTFDGSNCGKLCSGLNMLSDIDNWRKINSLIFSSGNG